MGIQTASPAQAIRQTIKFDGKTIKVGNQFERKVEQETRIFVTGAGKASAKMALALEELLEEKRVPVENKPISGFKLSQVRKRSSEWFGSGRHVWRIEHPLGFEFEISSENLFALIENCTIEDGEIKEKCVIAFSGAYMSLISVNSQLYRQTFINEARLNASVKESELELGQRIVLKDGTEGIYLGRYKCISSNSHYGFDTKLKSFIKLITKGNHVNPIQAYSKLDVSYGYDIEEKDLTADKIIDKLNEIPSSEWSRLASTRAVFPSRLSRRRREQAQRRSDLAFHPVGAVLSLLPRARLTPRLLRCLRPVISTSGRNLSTVHIHPRIMTTDDRMEL